LGFSLLVAVGLALIYAPNHNTWPNIYYLMLPAVILLQIFFTTGICLFMATLGLYFPDTSNIMGHLLRMWYFLSPGLYSISLVPERFVPIYRLNPFCGLMTSYRDIIMKGRMPATSDLLYVLTIGMVCFVAGFTVFKRYEGRFAQKL
jgi:ABC-type polysaccharide/polyol phosphate export permease